MDSETSYSILNIVQSAIVLVLVLYVLWKAIANRRIAKKHRYFAWLALSTALMQLFALFGRVLKSKFVSLPIAVHYVAYILMFISMVVTAWGAMQFLLHLRNYEKRLKLHVQILMAIPCVVLSIASILSPWTHWVFYIDESLAYQRGSLFILQLVCPYFYALAATVQMVIMGIRGWKKGDRRAIRYFLCFIVPIALGGILQLALNVDGGYAAIGMSISVILLYAEFYVVEVRKLDRAVEMEVLNVELQEKQERLEESANEQEAQIQEITALNEKLNETQLELRRRLAVINAVSQRYFCAYTFNLENNTFHEVFALPAMHAKLGADGEASVPLNLAWKVFVVPEDQPIMKEFHDITKWKDFLRDRDIHSVEYRGVTSGWSRASLFVANRDERGEVTGVVYTLERIHEQKEAELRLDAQLQEIISLNEKLQVAAEAADAANAAKTSFLFNMSHDIRTPMNAIIGFRDLLEKHQEDPKRRADYLAKIEESSNVLLSIINNVLEMARIEKGTIEIDETAWSAEQFNDTLYSIFHEMMSQKGIAFTRTIDVEHPYVYCDPIKLREVFINILSNAYKYTNAGGSVDMHLREVPSDREGYAFYQTTISDTGIGMSEEFLPHLFDEFAREHNTTEAKIEGTGLGMSIVKRLVAFMDGTIEVKSQVGVGTTFVVTIPHRIADRSNLVEHAGVTVDPKLFQGKRILLAEDNDLNAEIAVEILGEAGFLVDRVEDGALCCKRLAEAPEGHYALILMDIQMPNMNGYEAARAIRQMGDSAKASLPILAMTANAFEEDKREALRAGMNAHITKPINVTELMKALSLHVS